MRGRIKLLFLLLLAVLMGRAQTISQYEYWLDADYGHRQVVATNSTAVDQSIDISGLSDGIHYLNFRAVDGDGVSGLYYRYLFMVPASEMTDATVSGYEYWIDADYANRVSSSEPSTNVAQSIDVSRLSSGVHYLNFRAKRTDGEPGLYYRYLFVVPEKKEDYLQIDQVKYWVDDDSQNSQTLKVNEEQELIISMDISQLKADTTHVFNITAISKAGLETILGSYEFSFASELEPEPYAVLTTDSTVVLSNDSTGVIYGKTLTFFYDDQKAARNGMSVGPFGSTNDGANERAWNSARQSITSVAIDSTFAQYDGLTSTAYWFANFNNLTDISGLNYLNMANVTFATDMFRGCTSLTSLDLSIWSVPNLGDMGSMFSDCTALITLDLSNWHPIKAGYMNFMFGNCINLRTIYVNDQWALPNDGSLTGWQYLFSGCESLVGGRGTTYDPDHIDSGYAHIDGGVDNPGYFTLNPERVKNGNVEGEDYSSFALSYNLQVQELTQENIVEDSEHPGNQCIKVVSLENPEEVTHSQFMIRIGEPMKTGQKYRFSMDYKASKGALVTSQVHTEPGEYLNWYGFGNFTATPEWQTYEVEGEVSTENNGFKTIVFNLSEEKSSTEFFFDNISFKVDAVEEEVPDTVETPMFEFANSWDSDLSIKTETEGAEIYYTMSGRMLKEDDANFSYGTLGRYSDWKAWGDNLQEAKSVYNEDVYAGSYSSNYMLKLTSRVDSVMESAQLGYRFNKALTKNDYYTIHFQARSASGNGQIQFFCQNDTLADTRSVADTMAIGKEWADYEFTLKIDNDSTNQIVLNFGGVADTYYIDNVLFGPIISDTINGNLRTRYERPIEIRDDVTVTAVAVKEGMIESKPAVYDYFYEGWMMLLYTYEKGIVILDECDGDPNVPLSDVYEMKARMDDMLYSYYERRTEERFDDYELKYAADEMMARLDMVYQMKQGFVINGIAYHAVDSTQVEVRKPLGYGSVYKGAVTIAPEVFYNNINFRVTSVTEDAFANSELGAIVWNADFTVPDEVSTMVNNPNLLVYVKSDALAPRNITNVVINGVAKDIVLVDATTDNGNFLVPETFTAEQISYQRVFNQKTMVGVCRGWESIALPFNVQTITHEKQGAISPFGRGDSNKHFWLRRLGANGIVQADKIEAYVPYIIAMPNSSEYSEQFNLPGRVTFSATNAIVPVTEERTLALSDSTIMMTSTMQRLGRSSRYYAINVGEVRGQYLEGSVFERDYREIRPFEAYTTHAANAPAPRFVPIDDINGGNMTGIEASLVNSEEVNSEKWYDLNGRKLQKKPTQKGVYLLNGRKVVMR